MKVSELLDGALLDYWVAKALADRLARIVGAEEHERCETRFGDQWPWNRFSPSSAWMDGGPIIEREGISIARWEIGLTVVWNASDRDRTGIVSGPTPLIAAMRRYVASKFGEEVPDEVPA